LRNSIRFGTAILGALLAAGCRQDMHNQPKYKPLAATDFFGDGRSARPMIEDTVARGHLRLDSARYTGKVSGNPVDAFPFKITLADMRRGQERFNIFCSPCHGRLGNGQGMIPKRGFRQPPSYHIDRLRKAPVGHFFDVATNGFGAMPSYASRVPVDDRWRIIAYIRALQYSDAATMADVPAGERTTLAQMPENAQPVMTETEREQRTGELPQPPAQSNPGRATEK
jgi:mono/diheme cytochrome c family protein